MRRVKERRRIDGREGEKVRGCLMGWEEYGKKSE